MFDLAGFDKSLERRRMCEVPGDDTLLTDAVRDPADTALTAMDAPKSLMVVAFLAYTIVAGQDLLLRHGAEAMTYNGMSPEEFALHLHMPANDPRMISTLTELGTV